MILINLMIGLIVAPLIAVAVTSMTAIFLMAIFAALGGVYDLLRICYEIGKEITDGVCSTFKKE